MDPTTVDDLLRGAGDAFLKVWNELPESVKEQVRAEWNALMAAIQAARAAGVGSSAEFRLVLEALKRFIAALARAGASVPKHVATWVELVEQQVAALAAEAEGGAAAGAGLTAAAVLLVLLAAILAAMSIHEIYLAKGPADPPVGGKPCGEVNPIARGMEAESYSHFGQRAAFKAAEAEARAAAQQFTCPGTCASGKCRGNCAILDVSYKYWGLWTTCTVKYDIWCECY